MPAGIHPLLRSEVEVVVVRDGRPARSIPRDGRDGTPPALRLRPGDAVARWTRVVRGAKLLHLLGCLSAMPSPSPRPSVANRRRASTMPPRRPLAAPSLAARLDAVSNRRAVAALDRVVAARAST
ncbi:hypothetical protein QYE76_033885 [Lolium multiflorum]|uniref:Uncharacterized protein n=1 Tax=Lolium multiflorum TaxID=4521 RepID=A0AAD8QY82_LOLMU|nr:hypothetical protein QYE76_033885 [Lolium multiflorum]